MMGDLASQMGLIEMADVTTWIFTVFLMVTMVLL